MDHLADRAIRHDGQVVGETRSAGVVGHGLLDDRGTYTVHGPRRAEEDDRDRIAARRLHAILVMLRRQIEHRIAHAGLERNVKR